MKIFILWALLQSGRWTPVMSAETFASCQTALEDFNKKDLDAMHVIRFICLPPQVKPGKLFGA